MTEHALSGTESAQIPIWWNTSLFKVQVLSTHKWPKRKMGRWTKNRCVSHKHKQTQTQTQKLTLTHTHILSLSHTFNLIPREIVMPVCSPVCIHTHTHTHTHSHTHTHILSLTHKPNIIHSARNCNAHMQSFVSHTHTNTHTYILSHTHLTWFRTRL